MDISALVRWSIRTFEMLKTDVLPRVKNFVHQLRRRLPEWLEKLENFHAWLRARCRIPWIEARPRLHALLQKMNDGVTEFFFLAGSVVLFVCIWRVLWF